MKKPFVTLVVLTYCKFEGIKKNLESIAKQDYTNFEVLIKDDGSPNFDRGYLEGLASSILGDIPWSVHTSEKNEGTVRSYNKAFELAKGEYVFLLAQDDRFYDEAVVSHIVDYMEKNPHIGACTSKRIGETTGRMYPETEDIKLLEAWDTTELWKRVLYENFISGSTLYYRKSFHTVRGGFDTEFLLVEDYPLVVSMILNDEQIGFLDEVTIYYGEDGVSSGTPSEKILIDRMKIYEKFIEPNLESVNSVWMRRYLKYFYGDIELRHNKVQRIIHNLKSWRVILRILYAKNIKKLGPEERYYLFK